MDIDKMEAGPEMDKRMATEVMGWIKTDSNLYVGSPLGRVYAVHKFWNDEDELNKEIETIGELRRINQMFTLWQPSTDIAAAWQMEERIAELGLIGKYCKHLNEIANARWDAGEKLGRSWQLIHASPDDRCRAALLTMEE